MTTLQRRGLDRRCGDPRCNDSRPSGAVGRPDLEWRVTASHRVTVGDWDSDPASVPFGVQHTRIAGEPLALCGQFVAGWPIFWKTPFDPSHEHACTGCVQVFLAQSPSAPILIGSPNPGV